ncbi:MAG: hypothetical protein E6Q67_03010 [Roseateles sp.]|nr:MAG: hypothetical protein E6Q67_03010 [Roseateles sp.]
MSEELFISNGDIERHIGRLGLGGEGRSATVEAGNAAVTVLKAALAKAGVAVELRAPIIGHFCNEWNAGIESGAIRI